MRHVIAGVSKYSTAICSQCRVPVPKDNGVCKFPERGRKCDEQCRRHNQPILIHGKIVVDAVEYEMQRNANSVVGQMPAAC
jgi:hypothetical protein